MKSNVVCVHYSETSYGNARALIAAEDENNKLKARFLLQVD